MSDYQPATYRATTSHCLSNRRGAHPIMTHTAVIWFIKDAMTLDVDGNVGQRFDMRIEIRIRHFFAINVETMVDRASPKSIDQRVRAIDLLTTLNARLTLWRYAGDDRHDTWNIQTRATGRVRWHGNPMSLGTQAKVDELKKCADYWEEHRWEVTGTRNRRPNRRHEQWVETMINLWLTRCPHTTRRARG